MNYWLRSMFPERLKGTALELKWKMYLWLQLLTLWFYDVVSWKAVNVFLDVIFCPTYEQQSTLSFRAYWLRDARFHRMYRHHHYSALQTHLFLGPSQLEVAHSAIAPLILDLPFTFDSKIQPEQTASRRNTYKRSVLLSFEYWMNSYYFVYLGTTDTTKTGR